MQEIVAFLQEQKVFYLATVTGNKPRVRPFGFVMEYEGKLYFATSNEKQVYRQLQENPHICVSATAPDGQWLRLEGRVTFHTTAANKAAAFAAMPVLRQLYEENDPRFTLFYLAEGEGTFHDRQGAARTIVL